MRRLDWLWALLGVLAGVALGRLYFAPPPSEAYALLEPIVSNGEVGVWFELPVGTVLEVGPADSYGMSRDYLWLAVDGPLPAEPVPTKTFRGAAYVPGGEGQYRPPDFRQGAPAGR